MGCWSSLEIRKALLPPPTSHKREPLSCHYTTPAPSPTSARLASIRERGVLTHITAHSATLHRHTRAACTVSCSSGTKLSCPFSMSGCPCGQRADGASTAGNVNSRHDQARDRSAKGQ